MCKISNYPGLYIKAKEVVRRIGINPVMPGYEMLIKAIVTCKVQGTENLYSEVEKESSVVPALKGLTPEEEERPPVKQMILESMRSVGIKDESVKMFVQELADQI